MIANAIVDQMEKEKILHYKMREHYLYALITTIEKWITVISILCIGIIFKQVVPMILFLTFFSLCERGQAIIMQIRFAKVIWEARGFLCDEHI